MNQAMQADLVINGVSTASGGRYDRVKIDGVGTVEGDLICDDFDCNGMTKVRGSLTANRMDADGMFTVDGSMSAGSSIVDGQMRVKGSLKAESFAINGLLHGRGKAKEIGGETIEIKRKARGPLNKLLTWFVPRFAPELKVDTIEGDDIELEYTEAVVVRGNRVVIGKGCTIDLVEYRTELKAHPGAKIGKEAKIGG